MLVKRLIVNLLLTLLFGGQTYFIVPVVSYMDLIDFLLKPLKYVSSCSIYIMSWSWSKVSSWKEVIEIKQQQKNQTLIEHIIGKKKTFIEDLLLLRTCIYVIIFNAIKTLR